MTSRRTCRWAALSLSSIATQFFPDLLGREEAKFQHELVAVSTTGSSDRAKRWLTDNKIAGDVAIYHSWESMLEKGDFNIVYISTPHPLHYEHVLKALKCKRNVLVEKPAVMNAAQYERCISLAKEQNVVLMEAMWTRYLPITKHFKEELLPKLGDIRRVYAEFSFPIYSPDMPHSSRFLDKKAGAGSLLDQGVYALTWVDLAFNGLRPSPMEVVHADMISIPNVPGDVDDMNTIILRRKDAVAIITTSMTMVGSNKPDFYTRFQSKKHSPSVRIEGTKGAVAVPFPLIRPDGLSVQWYDEASLDSNGREKDEVITKPLVGWGIWYQADVIAKAVFDGYSGTINADESLRVLRWMDKARELAGIKYAEELHRV